MSTDQTRNWLTRRAMLGGMAIMATPAQTATAALVSSTSVDAFLSSCSPAERVRYHSNELLLAMEEMHPGRKWRSQIDHELCFAFFTRCNHHCR